MFPLQLVDSSKFVPVELEKVKAPDADREWAASKLSQEDFLHPLIVSFWGFLGEVHTGNRFSDFGTTGKYLTLIDTLFGLFRFSFDHPYHLIFDYKIQFKCSTNQKSKK